MTTTTPPDIAALVKGLTKAQRAALDEICQWSGWASATDMNIGRPATVGATMDSLSRRRLVRRQRDATTWGRSEYQATDLGQQVRAALKETRDAG